MNKQRKEYIKSCKISAVESVKLSGYTQKIAIEGKTADLPVLLTLHGGPGSPLPFSVGCRGLYPEFSNRFIMVYWDQLGCGINNRPLDDGFSIRDFVNMTKELVCYLHEKFPDNKLYLFGMSWGSILALQAALAVPDLISGVVTYGQVISAPLLSDSAFEAVASSSAPEKHKNFVKSLQLKNEPTYKDLSRLSKTVRKYTDGYFNRKGSSPSIKPILKGLLSSPDYKFRHFIAVFINGYAKCKSLLAELGTIDLKDALLKVSVPYKIFQGETDVVCDTAQAVNIVNAGNNPNLSIEVIADSGHFPSDTAFARIFKYLSES